MAFPSPLPITLRLVTKRTFFFRKDFVAFNFLLARCAIFILARDYTQRLSSPVRSSSYVNELNRFHGDGTK